MKNNKNLTIFLICTIISVVIWLSMSMGNTFQKTYNIPIVYQNIPLDKRLVNEPLFLKTTISSSGWNLFTKNIKKRNIYIDLTNNEISNFIKINDTKSIVNEHFPELNILAVSPSTLTLKVKKLLTKKIPIRLNLEKDFKTNFYINQATILKPDSVLIVSNSEELNEVLFLETEMIKVTEKDSAISDIKLIIPENVTSNIIKTNAKFNIEEFAEKEFTIPVNIENKPKNSDLVFYPEEIGIKCLIPFSEFEKIIASDFYISADFNNIEVSNNNTLDLSIRDAPKSVKNIQLEKDNIEFIIYSN